MNIINRRIKDPNVMWLIAAILKNHVTENDGKGMPIGNLTSQFFANVYLNELDQYIKHKLKVKCYIRYVDDFAIFHKDKRALEKWRHEIDSFLKEHLKIELHPEKTRIIRLDRGVTLLGFRLFRNHKLLKKSNARRIWKRLENMKKRYDEGEATLETVKRRLDGWLAYAKFANTYNLRSKVVVIFNRMFGFT